MKFEVLHESEKAQMFAMCPACKNIISLFVRPIRHEDTLIPVGGNYYKCAYCESVLLKKEEE